MIKKKTMTRKAKKNDDQERKKNNDQKRNPRTVNPTWFQEEDLHVRSDEIGHGTIGRELGRELGRERGEGGVEGVGGIGGCVFQNLCVTSSLRTCISCMRTKHPGIRDARPTP